MKKTAALLLAALMLLCSCSKGPGSTEATKTPDQTQETQTAAPTDASRTETEPETTQAALRSEIIIWTVSGEEERTRTLCEYYLGSPQMAAKSPEGNWTVLVKTVPAEDLISRMKEATDTSSMEGVLPDVEEMPDMYFFYSDDFDLLYKAGLLSQVPQKTADALSKKTEASAIRAASSVDRLMAYPAALDHTLLLYYDKSVVGEIGDLESVIEQCEEADCCFYVGSETTLFPASVFASCGLSYTTELRSDGSVAQADCDYYTEKGLAAAKLLQSLMSRDGFRAVEGSPSLAFAYEEDRAGAMIAESYLATEIQAMLDEDFGVAALPAIADGEDMIAELSTGTFTMIGVTPKKDDEKRLACHALAELLVSAQAQTERFTAGGTIPVHTSALDREDLSENETASALIGQMPYVRRKTVVSAGYYEAMENFTLALLEGGSELRTAKLQQMLDELSAFLMADVAKKE